MSLNPAREAAQTLADKGFLAEHTIMYAATMFRASEHIAAAYAPVLRKARELAEQITGMRGQFLIPRDTELARELLELLGEEKS